MHRLRGKRVLVVDHQKSGGEAIARVLKEHRAIVVQAENGTEALDLFERHPYDVVLTEYELREMRGDVLAEAIKAFDPNQRVVLMTGFLNLVRRSRGVALTIERPLPGHCPRLQILHDADQLFVDAILLKPCSLEQLAAALIGPGPMPVTSPHGKSTRHSAAC
jgi:CheY-like chemotaxis protein